MPRPVVAIIGRPNVGKSTFFNRLIGERQAIVEDQPGTTRDRIYGQADWNGVDFTVVDTGGIRIQTAAESQADAIVEETRAQAEMALAEADAVIFMVDARDGLTSADELIAALVRRSGKPVVLAANKAESAERRLDVAEFYQLGLGEPIPVSAIHGTGSGDLLDALIPLLPAAAEPAVEDETVQVAIAGRPNVGKSALLNALLGQSRAIVSPVPGTTRDAIDTQVAWDDQAVTLIDTAGIRRRGRVELGVEHYSVIRALRAIDRADVVLLVIDSEEGLTAQDAHIAGYIQDQYKGLVLVMNKWDLVAKDARTMQQYTEWIHQALDWLVHVPLVFISALTGQRVNTIAGVALAVAAERARRVPTAELNKALRAAVAVTPMPARGGRAQKFFYATQPAVKPPTFVLYVTDPETIHFSYRRYLENAIRRAFGFAGVPLRLSFRARSASRQQAVGSRQ